jgi:hypothetical protein
MRFPIRDRDAPAVVFVSTSVRSRAPLPSGSEKRLRIIPPHKVEGTGYGNSLGRGPVLYRASSIEFLKEAIDASVA